MNPSDLTSATAARHVDDLRAAARHARLAALVRGCRETTIERTGATAAPRPAQRRHVQRLTRRA